MEGPIPPTETSLFKHPAPHTEIWRRHRAHWNHSHGRSASILSIILFFASITFNYFAEIYATEKASNPVTDIILSNTPAFNVSDFFVYGAIALIVFTIFVLIANPKRIPFTLHSFTLFYFIRGIFITLTHIGPFPLQPPVDDFGTLISNFVFGGGLFFSGHTGAPFLLALLFWEDKVLRYVFIVWSLVLAATALLGHFHYTIDVASAYFITYAIFHMSGVIFKKDHELFQEGPLPKNS